MHLKVKSYCTAFNFSSGQKNDWLHSYIFQEPWTFDADPGLVWRERLRISAGQTDGRPHGSWLSKGWLLGVTATVQTPTLVWSKTVGRRLGFEAPPQAASSKAFYWLLRTVAGSLSLLPSKYTTFREPWNLPLAWPMPYNLPFPSIRPALIKHQAKPLAQLAQLAAIQTGLQM